MSSVDGEENAIGVTELAEEEESTFSEVEVKTELRPATSHSPERTQILKSAPLTEGLAEGQEEEEPQRHDNDSDGSDMQTENGDVDGDGEELPVGFHEVQDLGYDSESGESLYHDTAPTRDLARGSGGRIRLRALLLAQCHGDNESTAAFETRKWSEL